MKAKKAKLCVVRSKGVQLATFGGSDATADATQVINSDLKAVAARVLARNTRSNSCATNFESTSLAGATFYIPTCAVQTRLKLTMCLSNSRISVFIEIGIGSVGEKLRW